MKVYCHEAVCSTTYAPTPVMHKLLVLDAAKAEKPYDHIAAERARRLRQKGKKHEENILQKDSI